MTTHRADCADCAWSFEDDDLEAVSDRLERHSRKEQHHVDFERTIATDGGLDYDVVDAICEALREELDPGQWKVLYARRIADRTEYSAHRVGSYLGRICGNDPRYEAIEVDDPELQIEEWDPASSVCRWRVERLERDASEARSESDGERELVADGGERPGREVLQIGYVSELCEYIRLETSECVYQSEDYEEDSRDVVQGEGSVAGFDIFWAISRTSCLLPTVDSHRPFRFKHGDEPVHQQQDRDEIDHRRLFDQQSEIVIAQLSDLLAFEYCWGTDQEGEP